VLESTGVPLLDAGSMEEAVQLATQRAHAGDAVLMSPACASFDMFRNYPAPCRSVPRGGAGGGRRGRRRCCREARLEPDRRPLRPAQARQPRPCLRAAWMPDRARQDFAIRTFDRRCCG
jgi:hypothetical protein